MLSSLPYQRMALLGGRYAVQQLLRTTLYGAIYVCEDTQIPDDNQHAASIVAVKEVSLRRAVELLDASQQLAQQLDDPREERAVARRLRQVPPHPNVVRYIDEFIEHEHLCFVIEYCERGDLYEFAKTQPAQRLACAEALGIIEQVAAGIAFLHAQGIAHRDVSLENVLLDSNGVCKLSDFGLAVNAELPCRTRAGKTYYMAPEVEAAARAGDGYAYDARGADVWSLGMLLFILISGSPLVSEASADISAFATIEHAGVGEILDAWGAAETLWPSAIALLEGMLQVDPARRLDIQQVVRHDAFVERGIFAAAERG
jgi:serine/threonine protein kinase